MESIAAIIARELGKSETHVENVIKLIDEGNTIPFIARYRKESHGAMDDTALRALADRLKYLRGLDERREEIKRSIAAQEKLTPELEKDIDAAETLAVLEDIYRPYKQKRRTRATVAKERGLEPLAAAIFEQSSQTEPLESLATPYVSGDLEVADTAAALAGAADIISEWISDSAEIRGTLRERAQARASISSEADKEEDSVYRTYYGFNSPLKKLQGHQVLALNRGEKEGFLKVSIVNDEQDALETIWKATVKNDRETGRFVRAAGEDAWSRLIKPSLERELRAALTEAASEGAIHNFVINLRPLLMQPPVKGHVTMGLDPGYRNGCKVAVVDATGRVLDTAVVYPTFGERQKEEAIAKLSSLIKKHRVEHIAIGNGTASRETEQMVAEMIRRIGGGVSYMVVNEAGASVYSASKLAAEEFPQFDVNLRSAVSIARRLQDPLAELVKIDPKSIGVGQYQHDMPQKRLDEALAGVVEDCVNAVGVDVNTASPSLLKYVSGLTAATAKNIVAYREENGAFSARRQLLKVPKLGPRAFEQCAGFIRVPESGYVLDNTGVHPESCAAAEKLLGLVGYTLQDVSNGGIGDLPAKVKKYGTARAAEECGVGRETLEDIVRELMKPGRDPRDELPAPILRTDVMDINDLQPGMRLTGTVRNVIDFGAFVDIGVHQDGLVHISEIADRFIRHPSEILSVGDVVEVVVLSVEAQRKRISLSIKQAKKKQD